MSRLSVECNRIPERDGLDEITVFWLDFAPGKGSVTVACYGEAWTAYFGAMNNQSIRQFFSSCDNGYLVNKLGNTANLKQAHVKRHDAHLGRIVTAIRHYLS